MTRPPVSPIAFVSYARRDGENFARQLRERLALEGIALWRDREGMEGGRDWWQQITSALDEVSFLVLVMTAAAAESALVRREWRYARQHGVVVYPVIADPALDFDALPRWMRSVHFYDLEHEWTKFLNDLQTRPNPVRVPFMVEDLSIDFVKRPHELDRLVGHLLDEEKGEPLAVTAALCGAGGYGKTVLARAICHDECIQNAFDDGILWVTLGESPGDLTARVEDLIYTLSGIRPGFAGVEAASAMLAEMLVERDILIVIDDVWDSAHLAPFMQGGQRCARLITTRMSDALPLGCHRIDVAAMRRDEATALVAHDLPHGHEGDLSALAQRLGEWPMLLKLVNAALRERILNGGQDVASALAYMNKALDKRGVTVFDARDAKARHRAVARTLELSITQLSDAEQARFEELAIFPEDVGIPLDVLASYWAKTGCLDEFDTETLCDRLSRLSLILDFDLATRFIRLHDVVRHYLQVRSRDVPGLHALFLETFRPADGWASLNSKNVYLWRWLFHHLQEANKTEDMVRTSLDLRFLAAKTKIISPLAVEADLGRAQEQAPDEALGQLRRSYAQSAHVLARCESVEVVHHTLFSRLQHIPALARMVRDWEVQLAHSPHLSARHPLPDLPHPALMRTIGGSRGSVFACAVNADGTRMAVAGAGHVIRIVDPETGQELNRLTGHTGPVEAVKFSPDGRWLASASHDRRLRLWDASSGESVTVVAGHVDSLTDCVFAPDGSFVVTAAVGGILKIWELPHFSLRHTLARIWDDQTRGWFESANDQGHWTTVRGCDVSPDSRLVASASADQTVIVWDVRTGRALHVLSGHEASVNHCCFSPDGTLLASAGGDRTARIWSCSDLARSPVVLMHDKAVATCMFTHDGLLVCATADGTLTVWDVSTGKVVRTLTGHTAWVNDLAMTPGGDWMASASNDGTVKLWNMRAPTAALDDVSHVEWILGCAASPDGSEVYTASNDRSLISWVTESARPLRVLRSHEAGVRACAVSPDGRWLASGSADRTVMLWDVQTGERHSKYEGHRDWVNDCAFDPTGRLLASVSNDRTLRLWDLQTRSRRLAFIAHNHWINSCAFSTDARYVVSAGGDGSLKRWPLHFDEALWERWLSVNGRLAADVATELLQPMLLSGHTGSVNCCRFAPDGSFMVSCGNDASVQLWDIESGTQIRSLLGHASPVNGCHVSADSSMIASVSEDGAIKVWRAVDGVCLMTTYVDGELSGCCWDAFGSTFQVVGARGIYFFRI